MTRPTKHPKTGVYRIRKGVPKALRAAVGRRELIRSLGTKDRAEAKRLAPPVLAEFEAILSAARGEVAAVALPETIRVRAGADDASHMQAALVPQRRAEPALTSKALLDAWAAETQPSAATLQKYGGTFRSIARILGFDDVKRITRDDVVRFKEVRLTAEGRSVGTVEDDVRAAGTVCKWAVANTRLSGNPFDGLAPKAKRRGPAPRAPFDDDEAKRILTAARQASGALRWLPWLLCFTGARIGELAELRRRDVRNEGGVPILDICPTDARAGKNETMQRMIPLHPALIEEGFLAYVESLPSDPGGPLFPNITASSDGTRTTNAQAEHGRWMRGTVKITDAKKAPAHSWRHRMEDELRKARALPEVQDAITGRHNPRNAGAGYGKGFRGMPDEVLKDLRKVPSPLGDQNLHGPEVDEREGDVGPSSAPERVNLRAAVEEWLQRELDRAYGLFRRGSGFFAAMLPEKIEKQAARAIDREATRRDAEGSLELLQEAFRLDDYRPGREGAREIAERLALTLAEDSHGFDVLSRLVMHLRGGIEEARMQWAVGEASFRPHIEPTLIGEAERALLITPRQSPEKAPGDSTGGA